MPLRFNPSKEQREHLAFLYIKYGPNSFQQNDVREYISRSMFKKFCDRNFIVKNGVTKIVAERKNGRGTNIRYINNWKLDKKCVERYIT
jgi:hypothetical protein